MPRLREKLSRNAFEHSASFDGNRAVQQIVEVYERLVSAKQQGDARGA